MAWRFRNDLPIYSQVVDILKAKIFIGEYLPGEKLPSVRDFAAEVGVNPNTMQKALSYMEDCGLVFSNRTTGRFITEDKAFIDGLKSDVATDEVNTFYKKMIDLGYSNDEIFELISQKTREVVVNG